MPLGPAALAAACRLAGPCMLLTHPHVEAPFSRRWAYHAHLSFCIPGVHAWGSGFLATLHACPQLRDMLHRTYLIHPSYAQTRYAFRHYFAWHALTSDPTTVHCKLHKLASAQNSRFRLPGYTHSGFALVPCAHSLRRSKQTLLVQVLTVSPGMLRTARACKACAGRNAMHPHQSSKLACAGTPRHLHTPLTRKTKRKLHGNSADISIVLRGSA
jgi:hypothetical protein